MSTETLVKCMHKPCQCLVEAEQQFCSAVCKTAKDSNSVACPCGHPDCIAEQRTGESLPGHRLTSQ